MNNSKKKIQKEKRMVYHHLHELQEGENLASKIRPYKMAKAFESLGYQVEYITGNYKERMRRVKSLKEKIKGGAQYDFLYSESSTSPTLLTGKGKLPHGSGDFQFLEWFKKNIGRTGLFYRDIYWSFPEYAIEIGKLKALIGGWLHRYDLKKYKSALNMLYLPSLKMGEYLPSYLDNLPKTALPPGFDNQEIGKQREGSGKIKLGYVGNITPPYYDLRNVLQTVLENGLEMDIVCRITDFEKAKSLYADYLDKPALRFHHLQGDDLKELLKSCDVGMTYRKGNEYLNFIMPVKIFDYLACGLPIIAQSNTETGHFIEKNRFGWCVDDDEHLSALLKSLSKNTAGLDEVKKSVEKASISETWKARAQRVVEDLSR